MRPSAALPIALACAACASIRTERRDWSSYAGPGAQHFRAEEVPFPHVEDPLEPLNRASAGASDAALRYGVRPVASLWRALAPRVAREALGRAFENLLFPGRLANNLLQGKLAASGVETARFALNSTVGLAGLLDPAAELGLEPQPEDFGQTFATWGWRSSTYLFIPLLGPSTVRDGLGELPDAALDPATYFFPAAQARGLNSLTGHLEADLRRIDVQWDAYEPARTLYTLQRELDVADVRLAGDDSAATQSLSAVFLAPEDPEFAGLATLRSERIAATGRELPYGLWLQPGRAPLFYVVPGFGGHRLSDAALAVAEIAWRTGHSVAVVSNPTNWEFMERAASVPVPGFGPVDARDLHAALTAIDRGLERRFPGRFAYRRLGGLSMGAYYALLLAAGEEEARSEGLLPFDLYVALDPPVSLEHGLGALDRFYNAPLAFPAEERAQRIDDIFAKVLVLARGTLEPNEALPFTRLESEFLIGLSFRLDLQYLLLASQERQDLGVLRTKRSPWCMAPAFREASEYSYLEYVYAFLLPFYAAREPDIEVDEAGARRLFERADLRSVARGLAANDRVRTFANENDFLLREEDVAWLRETLDERLVLFPAGGHLGNLHRDAIRDVIERTVQEAARP